MTDAGKEDIRWTAFVWRRMRHEARGTHGKHGLSMALWAALVEKGVGAKYVGGVCTQTRELIDYLFEKERILTRLETIERFTWKELHRGKFFSNGSYKIAEVWYGGDWRGYVALMECKNNTFAQK